MALRTQLISLKAEIQQIRDITEQLNASENQTSEELNQILSKIYLLGVSENAEGEKEEKDNKNEDGAGTNEEVKVEALIEEINNIALSASENDSFSNEDIQNVVSLKDDLILYTEYLALKGKLTDFIDNNLNKTYQDIVEAEKENNTEKEKKNSETADAVDVETWKNNRNKDFTTFYACVKSLPDVSDLDAKMEYDTSTVMEDASDVQRDLLGELTDFEKAFNYFKYRFPVMAYFSLFIAVFFDLGAFFTGCFLYSTEYFDKKKKE